MDEPPRFRQSSRKFARVQRQNMTRAESMLWRALRNDQIDGHGFRRQTPIGPYFADFVCLAQKIVVEADGRTHETADAKIKDSERDAWFRRAGFRVLRFPDELVIGGLPIVIERIRAALREHELMFQEARQVGPAGGAESTDASKRSRRRSSNWTEAHAAGHTPSGASRPLPRHSWGRGRPTLEMCEPKNGG